MHKRLSLPPTYLAGGAATGGWIRGRPCAASSGEVFLVAFTDRIRAGRVVSGTSAAESRPFAPAEHRRRRHRHQGVGARCAARAS
jgi:hypothetical protein